MSETKEISKPVEVGVIKKENEELRAMVKELRESESQLISKHAPEYAQMRYQIIMARELIKSKAFPNITPEQAFVLIQAGKEMNLQPMESIKKLYIVNGRVGFHSDGMVSRLTEKGCKIEYLNETPNEVTVKITYQGETFTERVTDKDQILEKSKAMTFAKKNKMRFHGVRMISSFYLPHLTGSVTVWEKDDFETADENKKGDEFNALLEMIEATASQAELETLYNEQKQTITKSLELVMSVGKKKKSFVVQSEMP